MAILPLFLIAALAATANADCYSHDGIKARDSKYYTGPELVSCGNGTANCCLEGQKCGTNLFKGADAAGVSLRDCGNNIYCCAASTEEACCEDERAFYVDPDNGSVTQTTEAAKTKSPRWFAVDTSSILASSTISSTPSSTSATQTPDSSSATSTSPSSGTPTPTETHESSSKISAGAGAGIGIGAAAGVALVGALVWYLLRRRKQKASTYGAASEVHGDTSGAFTHEKNGAPHDYYAHNGIPPTELGGSQMETQELDSGVQPNATRYELDGGADQAPKVPPGH
ncbi:hypothetical protein N0V90_007315 [Kalmusia sp. IMI 367209]|nr:hypothetical protein N0V90_007315 [Kalmusia sp. IMI 367209]